MSKLNTPNRLEFNSDRRRFARTEVDAGVVMEFSGQEYLLVAKDVSAGGLSASPHNGITESSEGTATFVLGDEHQQVSCRCRVIYSSDGRGIGVEFLDLSEESRQALNKFVDESN
jgi:c-di-GMP-binding flagellar brake protein YcgR